MSPRVAWYQGMSGNARICCESASDSVSLQFIAEISVMRNGMEEVVGSIPTRSTKLYPTSQLMTSVTAYAPKRSIARARALAASSARFLGGAVVSSDRSKRLDASATSSTAVRNAASLAFDGLLNPLILRTNCSDAARTSACVTGGSKLNSVLMFLHMRFGLESS